MFKDFETKIKLIIHLAIILILSVFIIFIYYSMKKIYTGEFINKTTELAVQYSQRSDYYMEDYEKRARQIVKNPLVHAVVCENINNPELNAVLTEESQAYDDILGVSVYSADYAYFSDKVIGVAPDFDFIRKQYITSEFESLESDIGWVIRVPESYSGYYQRSSYSTSEQGLYTCIYKIRDDWGVCRGYLLLDTNIKSIFELYQHDNVFLKNMDLYLKGAGDPIIGYLKNEGDAASELKVLGSVEEKNAVYKNVIYMFYPLKNSSNRLVMCVSTKGISDMMKIIMTWVIAIAIIFYLLSIFMGNRLIKSIIEPIHRLRQKIKGYNLEEE